MSFDSPLPPPIFGVSTVSEMSRAEGFCAKQVNWRNDQLEMLTRRPKTSHLVNKVTAWRWGKPDSVVRHTSFKDGVRQEVLVGAKRDVLEVEVKHRVGHEPFQSRWVSVDANWFEGGAADIGISAMTDGYYIWNRNLTMNTHVEPSPEPFKWHATSLINVTSALNYSERITIDVYFDASKLGTVTYQVPGITSANTASADAARATNAVAEGLAAKLRNDVLVAAEARGSNVVVWYADDANPQGSLRLEVSSGRGDTTVVVHNYSTSTMVNLPKYCNVGVVREIAPDPQSNKGRFFLKSVPVQDGVTGVQEVIWSETADPDGGTVSFQPHCHILHMTDTELTKFNFRQRQIGNDVSNPPRNFIGKKIAHIEVFQDRLAIFAGSKLNLSKTDHHDQFWLGSALELLVTDPTDLGTSGNNSTLRYAVFHNRDLLVFAEDAQFKIDGTTPITPQTAAMPLTTANECNLDVAPVLMGSAVYYANNYGGSAGVRRFEVEADTSVDTSVSITDHILGLIPGDLVEMVSNANQSMLVCRSKASAKNMMYVFERQMYDDKPVYSWCAWQLRAGVEINGLDLYDEVLTIWYNDEHYMRCDLKSGDIYPLSEISLDQLYKVPTQVNGDISSFVVPQHYMFNAEPKFSVLLNDGSHRDLIELGWSAEQPPGSNTWVVKLDEKLPEDTPVFIGFKYESLYEPTRPFLRNKQGVARTTDRLRIAHYFLELSNTYFLTRRIVSKWWDLPDEKFTHLDAASAEFIDELEPYTGQWRPQIGMNATDCDVQFIADSPYVATIASIAHRSQLYSTRNRR